MSSYDHILDEIGVCRVCIQKLHRKQVKLDKLRKDLAISIDRFKYKHNDTTTDKESRTLIASFLSHLYDEKLWGWSITTEYNPDLNEESLKMIYSLH
jgi:hypothetical protein